MTSSIYEALDKLDAHLSAAEIEGVALADELEDK